MINDPRGTGKRANAIFYANYKAKQINVRLTRDVKPGEQIFINYGDHYWTLAGSDGTSARNHNRDRHANMAMHVSMSDSDNTNRLPTTERVTSTESESESNQTRLLGTDIPPLSKEVEELTKLIHPSTDALKGPVSYNQIKKRPDAAQWQASRKVEMHNHLSNQTCVPIHKSKVPLGTKLLTWREVYKIKRGGKGDPLLYKSRFTLRGCAQTPDQYGETTAYVFSFNSLRVICAAVAINDWEMKQLDYVAAFPQSDIDEPLYAVPPQDLNIPENHVLKILKAIYGLKQAAKLWQDMLFAELTLMGYKPLIWLDRCIFMRVLPNGRFLLILVYVDDMPYAYSRLDEAEMNQDIAKLQKKFDLKLMGDAHQICGWRIIRDRDRKTLSLDLQGNIENALEEFGLSECRTAADPSTSWSILNAHIERKIMEESRQVTPIKQVISGQSSSTSTSAVVTNNYGHCKLTTANYRHAIGALLWICNLVPAIKFMTSVLARFNANPLPVHVEAVKKVFRYLAGVKDTKLIYQGNLPNGRSRIATFYTDSDYASDMSDSKSYSGHLVMLAGAAVSWYCKKQTTVAKSSCCAETIAACALVEEAEWVTALLNVLGLPQPSPTRIRIDNQTAIHVAKGKGDFYKSRHIRLKYHLLQDAVENQKTVDLEYIESKMNPADIFTKPKDGEEFRENVKFIMGATSSS